MGECGEHVLGPYQSDRTKAFRLVFAGTGARDQQWIPRTAPSMPQSTGFSVQRVLGTVMADTSPNHNIETLHSAIWEFLKIGDPNIVA